MTDTFELFDLRVTVEEIRGTCTCAQAVGDWFEVTEMRGRIEKGRVAQYQVKIKVGFRLED